MADDDVVNKDPVSGGASESLDDEEDYELPPAFEQLVDELKASRKRLLKEKAFDRGDQLKQFLGQFLIPQMQQIVELLGDAYLETYEMAAGTASSVARFQRTAFHHFKELGVKIDPSEAMPVDSLEKLQQAFYVLGALLAKKLPEDREMQDTYNLCMDAISDLVGVGLSEKESESKNKEVPEAPVPEVPEEKS